VPAMSLNEIVRPASGRVGVSTPLVNVVPSQPSEYFIPSYYGPSKFHAWCTAAHTSAHDIMYRAVILTSRLQGVAGTNNVELPPTDSMRMVVVVRSSIPVPRSCVSLDREPFAFSSSPSTCATG